MGFVVVLSPSRSTITTLLQPDGKLAFNPVWGEEKAIHEDANTPQAGSTVCFPIRAIWSNCGSNSSVSVRGYETKPCW